jgi:DNA-binding MarR family transcriptional regulator
MTKRIDRLERLGLVHRIADESDRRSVLVELAPEAQALVDEIVVAHLANEKDMLSPLQPQQRARAVEALRALLAALEH